MWTINIHECLEILFLAFVIYMLWTERTASIQWNNWIKMSEMNELERNIKKLWNEMIVVNARISAAEDEIGNGPSISSFCSLKKEVEEMRNGVSLASAQRRSVDALRHRVKELEAAVEKLSCMNSSN